MPKTVDYRPVMNAHKWKFLQALVQTQERLSWPTPATASLPEWASGWCPT
jgi:hypothetical protein